MATYTTVNDRRNILWLKNALKYRFSKMFRKDRDLNLWVFGAWEGQKFSDNSKYLFEYMLKNIPDIKCVWQTKNEKIYENLKSKGYPVQMIGTSESKETQRKAGVALYTNGLDDFGESPDVYGAKLIALWHGVGMKKIYRMTVTYNNGFKKIIGTMKWDFFNWVKRDLTLVTSEYAKKIFIEWFQLKRTDSILISGQPRNDIMKNVVQIEEVFFDSDDVDIIGDKRVILYMPTFRKNIEEFSMIISDFLDSVDLLNLLEKQNAILLVKTHYLNTVQSKDNKFIKILNDKDVSDPQKLLSFADYLITDYSSCAIDYALMKKPVLFYFPDWQSYNADNVMIEDTKEICSVNSAYNLNDLIERVSQMLDDNKVGMEQSAVLNRYFDMTECVIGEFSKQTYLKIKDFLKG